MTAKTLGWLLQELLVAFSIDLQVFCGVEPLKCSQEWATGAPIQPQPGFMVLV
jgi:hypothetical protein